MYCYLCTRITYDRANTIVINYCMTSSMVASAQPHAKPSSRTTDNGPPPMSIDACCRKKGHLQGSEQEQNREQKDITSAPPRAKGEVSLMSFDGGIGYAKNSPKSKNSPKCYISGEKAAMQEIAGASPASSMPLGGRRP